MGDLPQADDHPRLLPFRARTKTQGKVIENLLERLARRTLRAPTSGQILDLMGRTGDLFGPKRAVLTMVARHLRTWSHMCQKPVLEPSV